MLFSLASNFSFSSMFFLEIVVFATLLIIFSSMVYGMKLKVRASINIVGIVSSKLHQSTLISFLFSVRLLLPEPF